MERHHGILVETLINGPFGENCYLVADELTKDALLIDPGDEGERILERVRALDLIVREIVCTHAHVDHVGAVAFLQTELNVPFAVHAAERTLLENVPLQAQMFGLRSPGVPNVDRELLDGSVVAVGQKQAQVLATPGHSPGGVCFYFAEPKVVFVGDTLFAGSIGRTDLFGGSMETLFRSIRDRLLTLDDDVVVYSGHGPATTIGIECRKNPFLRGAFG